MIKLNRKTCFWSGTVVISLLVCLLPSRAALRLYFSPPVTESNLQHIALGWGDIWDSLRRKEVLGGRRGESDFEPLCMVTPANLVDIDNPQNKGITKVWSQTPLFLWQGTLAEIEVRNLHTGELMWNQTLEPTARSITYAGKPLEQGSAYFWRELLPSEQGSNDSPPPRVSFRILDTEEHRAVATELEELESKLQTEGTSQDEIVWQRVQYFEEKELWADVFREIYSQASSSSELINQIETHNFCPASEEN